MSCDQTVRRYSEKMKKVRDQRSAADLCFRNRISVIFQGSSLVSLFFLCRSFIFCKYSTFVSGQLFLKVTDGMNQNVSFISSLPEVTQPGVCQTGHKFRKRNK